jgi:hypothetical protein
VCYPVSTRLWQWATHSLSGAQGRMAVGRLPSPCLARLPALDRGRIMPPPFTCRAAVTPPGHPVPVIESIVRTSNPHRHPPNDPSGCAIPAANASSSAVASFNYRLPNPSVNQPWTPLSSGAGPFTPALFASRPGRGQGRLQFQRPGLLPAGRCLLTRAYGKSFRARMMQSTMCAPPEAEFSLGFCPLWSATTRGQPSPDHQAKNGPPDWPGQTSPLW